MKKPTVPAALALTLASLVLTAPAAAPQARAQPAAESSCGNLLSKVSDLLGRTEFLRARFRHTLRSRALGQDEVEEGVLVLARGGRMRWEYSAPQGKLALSDGRNSYLYLPDQKTVYVQPLPQGKEAPLPLRLLMGDVRLEKEFRCEGLIPKGSLAELLLAPVEPVEGVGKVRITVEASTGEVREVRYEDALGNEVSLSLEAVEHPAMVPAALFRFVPPEGCRIVQGG